MLHLNFKLLIFFAKQNLYCCKIFHNIYSKIKKQIHTGFHPIMSFLNIFNTQLIFNTTIADIASAFSTIQFN